MEPLAVALRAARLGEPEPGDVAVVFGLGIIGLGAVHWLKTMGASTVVAADPSGLRRERALALGADVVVDPASESTVEAVAALTGPGLYGAGARADVVLECSGAAPAFADAIRVARSGARLVIAALYKQKVELRPDRLVEKELTVRGSFGYRDEFPAVIAELERGGLDAEAARLAQLPARADPGGVRDAGRCGALAQGQGTGGTVSPASNPGGEDWR